MASLDGYLGYSLDVIALHGERGPLARRIVARARAISAAWWDLWDAMLTEDQETRNPFLDEEDINPFSREWGTSRLGAELPD